MTALALRRPLALAAAALAWLACSACVAQRDIVVTSTPPGGKVRLDQRMMPGVTPMTVPFTHYGKRRVTVYLDGYLTYSKRINIKPPWYATFPIDLFTEVLLPIGWHDRRRVHATLEPGEGAILAPDLAGVLQRADTLRRAGPEGPRPISPTADDTGQP
jgi:hypothetical protein